jgi:hypothetical protein
VLIAALSAYRLDTRLCSRIFFFKGDCGDFICGKCYTELIDDLILYLFIVLHLELKLF